MLEPLNLNVFVFVFVFVLFCFVLFSVKKGVNNFKIACGEQLKHANFWLEEQFPLSRIKMCVTWYYAPNITKTNGRYHKQDQY